MKWFWIALFIISASLPRLAIAGDECVELLRHGLRDYVQIKQGASQASEIRDDICTQYNQAKKASGSVTVGVKYRLFGGNVSVGWDQLEQIGSMMCESKESSSAAESSLDRMTSIISAEGVSAFKACMDANRHGIQYSLLFSNKFDSAATISIEYIKSDNSQVRIQKVIADEGITCEGELWKIRDGGDIGGQGGKSMRCLRKYTDKPFRDGGDLVLAKASSISIMTSADHGNIVIPFGEIGVRPPPPSSSDVLMSQFPIGIILAWYAKGPIPHGWAACDGQNGTPDLRKRFLRGVGIGDPIGKEAVGGSETHGHSTTVTLKEGNRKGSDWHWGDTPWAGGPNPAVGKDSADGKTNVASNLPPYTDVFYIMKIKE